MSIPLCGKLPESGADVCVSHEMFALILSYLIQRAPSSTTREKNAFIHKQKRCYKYVYFNIYDSVELEYVESGRTVRSAATCTCKPVCKSYACSVDSV